MIKHSSPRLVSGILGTVDNWIVDNAVTRFRDRAITIGAMPDQAGIARRAGVGTDQGGNVRFCQKCRDYGKTDRS